MCAIMAVLGLCTASPLGPDVLFRQREGEAQPKVMESAKDTRRSPNRETVPHTAHSTDGDPGGNISVTLHPGHLHPYFRLQTQR